MTAFQEIEQRFQKLQKQHQKGRLDETSFRVEVAKLMFRDAHGAFWMLDADSAEWFCNRGDGWERRDPAAASAEPQLVPFGAKGGARGRGAGGETPPVRRGLWPLLAVLATLLAVGGAMALLQWPPNLWNRVQQAGAPSGRFGVTIASPEDGSAVVLGQVVAIESMIEAEPDLRAVANVELRVDGQQVDIQPVHLLQQALGQTSLPLSQAWRPTTEGDFQVSVVALAKDGSSLATATVDIRVVEAGTEATTEPSCTPGATFEADVTIPPGTTFPPGTRMEKVWKVDNTGSCAWGMGYELVLLSGEGLGAPQMVAVPPTPSGEAADLAVTLWAPVEPGTYGALWQLRSPDGEFFGPTLPITIEVEAQAQGELPPLAPVALQGEILEGDGAVRLTWVDQADNEDAFRIYRDDQEASIGLAPANEEVFTDTSIVCGNTYRYSVVAFNAMGISARGMAAEVTLPPCVPADTIPTLSLGVVPTQVHASEPFTITFEAVDDLGLDLVVVWGQETNEPLLDAGRVFTCAGVFCRGNWSLTWTGPAGTTLTLVAIARDMSGRESDLARATVLVVPVITETLPALSVTVTPPGL